jgi:hypothetical protein
MNRIIINVNRRGVWHTPNNNNGNCNETVNRRGVIGLPLWNKVIGSAACLQETSFAQINNKKIIKMKNILTFCFAICFLAVVYPLAAQTNDTIKTKYRTLVADTTLNVKLSDFEAPVTFRFFNTTSPSKNSFNKVELEYLANTEKWGKVPVILDLEYLSGKLAEDGKTVEKYLFGFGENGSRFRIWEDVVPGLGKFFRDGRFRCRIPFKE